MYIEVPSLLEDTVTVLTDNSGVSHRRVIRRLMAALVVLSILLAGALGYIAVTDVAPRVIAAISNGDPYRNWPATGTKPPFADDTPFKAQGIVALTCRDGEAHIDQNMLVGSRLGEDVKPSWFINFYVDYDQSRNQDTCEVRFAPLNKSVRTVALNALGDNTGWSMQITAYAFDGLDSISAKLDGGDIALLLVDFGSPRVDPGVDIMYGDNGIMAPARELLAA